MRRPRVRETGIIPGTLPTGPWNAITDVPGVRVGYASVIEDVPRVVRTGVTAIWPCEDENWTTPIFAGCHSFNGNGEVTGMAWLAEQGLLSAPICITSTNCVGTVRDAICKFAVQAGAPQLWHLPVVGETCDGILSDPAAFPVTDATTFAALSSARSGPLAEGNVGGGTGMVAHGFKGGTGTASRVAPGGYTVGAIVQANYGLREMLRINGVPVGRSIGAGEIPIVGDQPLDMGSIIVVLATDAPLLPIQCQRLARRATVGLAWVGGIGNNGSGDIFIAFSTANRVDTSAPISNVRMLAPEAMTGLFLAAAEATEEAILNALFAAETVTGYQGRTAQALPIERVLSLMRKAAVSS